MKYGVVLSGAAALARTSPGSPRRLPPLSGPAQEFDLDEDALVPGVKAMATLLPDYLGGG